MWYCFVFQDFEAQEAAKIQKMATEIEQLSLELQEKNQKQTEMDKLLASQKVDIQNEKVYKIVYLNNFKLLFICLSIYRLIKRLKFDSQMVLKL